MPKLAERNGETKVTYKEPLNVAASLTGLPRAPFATTIPIVKMDSTLTTKLYISDGNTTQGAV